MLHDSELRAQYYVASEWNIITLLLKFLPDIKIDEQVLLKAVQSESIRGTTILLRKGIIPTIQHIQAALLDADMSILLRSYGAPSIGRDLELGVLSHMEEID